MVALMISQMEAKEPHTTSNLQDQLGMPTDCDSLPVLVCANYRANVMYVIWDMKLN